MKKEKSVEKEIHTELLQFACCFRQEQIYDFAYYFWLSRLFPFSTVFQIRSRIEKTCLKERKLLILLKR